MIKRGSDTAVEVKSGRDSLCCWLASCDSRYRLEQIIKTSFSGRRESMCLTRRVSLMRRVVRLRVLHSCQIEAWLRPQSLVPPARPPTPEWAPQRKSRRKNRTKTGERQSQSETSATAAAAARKKNTTADCKPRPQALHIPPSPTTPPTPAGPSSELRFVH